MHCLRPLEPASVELYTSTSCFNKWIDDVIVNQLERERERERKREREREIGNDQELIQLRPRSYHQN